MEGGIKYDKVSINLNDPAGDDRHLKGMFLVRHSLYNPSFCSYSTSTDSYRFFVKLTLLVKFIWCCKNVFSFVIRCFSITGDSYFECAEKKEIQFLFRLGLDAVKPGVMRIFKCCQHSLQSW